MMKNDSIQFSPRFGLALANIKTLRLAFQVFEKESGANIRQLLTHLEGHLKNQIPDLKPWNALIEEDALYFWPGTEWDVLNNKDDGIGIVFDFNEVRKAWTDANPWVGIYVPTNWAQSKIFKEQLRQKLPKSFTDDWKGAQAQYPAWTHIELGDYGNEDAFDLNGLIHTIEQRAKQLVDLRPIIDSLIKSLR